MKTRAIFIYFAILFSFSCSSSGSAPQIDWSSGDEQGAEHAKFYVPLDHSRADGTQVELALIRFPATGTKKGSVFMNPGGPGGSAVEYVEYFAETSLGRRLRENFDLVAFDPRGSVNQRR